jgi:endonuclease/exonuclease/phosphatase family metal-dependent hydrolase
VDVPPPGRGLVSRAAAVALALGLVACASALNYLDPAGPSYESRFAALGRPAPSADAPLRVVTFNIAFAREMDRALEVLEGASPLRKPDLLVLQEMDAPSVERVARALGLNSVYMPSGIHPTSRRDFGSALLSPWPLVEPRKIVLPHGARVTHLRRAIVAATLVRGSRRVRVYGVHLPAPLSISGGSRREQVRLIIEDAASSPDPVIIAGDFNSHGVGKELVAAGFTWVTRDVGTTTRWHFFGLSYDHVFVRGLAPAGEGGPAFGVVEDNQGASDHRPVWALLAPAPDETDRPRS